MKSFNKSAIKYDVICFSHHVLKDPVEFIIYGFVTVIPTFHINVRKKMRHFDENRRCQLQNARLASKSQLKNKRMVIETIAP